ncbi:MAG: ABC transporter ATP-binding protein [Anaeroplasmataceae bacterium]
MIELTKISKFYNNNNNITIGLNEISLSLPRTGLVGIVGPSGSGKTTLLNILCGIEDYDSGVYAFNGKDISLGNCKKIFEKYSIINQDNRLFDNLTVYENLKIVLKEKDNEDLIRLLLQKFDLTDKINEKVINLSGGEIKRVSIARCLLIDNQVILCDEPTANLDKENSKKIMEILKDISNERLVIIVTHNENEISDYIIKKITMNNGCLESEDLKENDYSIKDNDDNLEIVNHKKIIFKALGLIRKSLFSILTILIMIITLGIYTMIINNIKYDSTNIILDSSVILNNDPSRIIIDNGNDIILENNKLQNILSNNDYYYNDYAFDTSFELNTTDFSYISNSIYINRYSFVLSYYNNYDYKIVVGRLPQNHNEILLMGDFSDKTIEENYYVSNMLNTSFNLKNSLNNYIITGIAQLKHSNKDIHYDKCILYSNNECSDIYDYLLLKNQDNLYANYLGTSKYVRISNYYEDDVICIPKNSSCYFNNLEVNLSEYNLINETFFSMNERTYLKIIKSLNCRLSIFVRHIEDLSKTVDLLDDYNILYPNSINSVEIIENKDLMILYANYVTIIVVGLLFIGIEFFVRRITYNRTRRYSSILKMIKVRKRYINISYVYSMIIDMIVMLFISIISIIVINTFTDLRFSYLLLAFVLVPLIDLFFIYNDSKKNINELYYSEVNL